VVVRCTVRLLKLLAPSEIADAQPAPDDWLVTLFHPAVPGLAQTRP